MIKNILIVDDSPVARKILKSCIPKDKGYEIFQAGDGKVGLEKHIEINPELTFLDLTMPVMDGVECLGEIKKYNQKAAVVVITADIQVQVVEQIKELGAVTVIQKPVNKDKLSEALILVGKYLNEG